jgi:Peptidase M50B-like
MIRVANAADRALALVKWPVAVIAVVFTPALALALWDVIRAVAHAPRHAMPFLTGAGGYLVGWYLVFRSRAVGSLFSTAEHELTHALFAWLTFHKVVQFRATWSRGGHVQYLGIGNWLITIAPYFFPTLSVFALIVLAFLPREYAWWGSAALGFTVAYHLTSTWRETHHQQPDLAKVGFPFAICFLPASNGLVYGVLLSFAATGGPGVAAFFQRVGSHMLRLAADIGVAL